MRVSRQKISVVENSGSEVVTESDGDEGVTSRLNDAAPQHTGRTLICQISFIRMAR